MYTKEIRLAVIRPFPHYLDLTKICSRQSRPPISGLESPNGFASHKSSIHHFVPRSSMQLGQPIGQSSGLECRQFGLEKLEAIAIKIMDSVIPTPQKRNSFHRSKRTMVKRAIQGHQKTPGHRNRGKSSRNSIQKSTLFWKILVDYLSRT